jgi:hypothetical protein
MPSKIERNLPNNAYEAATNATNASQTNPFATVNDIPTAGTGNQLISGGASYSGTGMLFNVSVLVYTIAGIEYTAAATDVTLLVGDPSNGRFDAIVATLDVNDNPIVEVVQGTPAVTPSTPTIGPDQVLVQYVLVGANATTPNITTEYVYRNDQTSDWQGSVNSSYCGIPNSANFTSTTPNPVLGGACCLSVGARFGVTSGTTSPRGTRFGATTPVNREDYAVLSFYIQFPSPGYAQQGKTRMYLSLWADDSFPTTNKGAVYLGYVQVENYCDISLMDTWQLVNIPTSAFFQNPSITTIGGMCFSTYPNICSSIEFALDEVKLQTGFGPSTNIATVDIFNEGNFVGDTARLDFKSASGLANKISENPNNASITISPNTPEITSTIAVVGNWIIDAADTSIAQISGQAVSPLYILNPINATRDGQQLIVKIKDNGFAVTLSWGPAWTAFTGVTLPSSTATSKWIYITAYYDQGSGNWHVIDVKTEV